MVSYPNPPGQTVGQDPGSGSHPGAKTLAQIVAEVRAYEPPVASLADPAAIAQLKDELVRQLTIAAQQRQSDRMASVAPAGAAGKVTDLAYDAGTISLTWSYMNKGDYDLSGEVGVSDITPIALHYLANTTDGVGNDALEAWIDGDASGEVGISDITPVAMGYMSEVKEYRILTSNQATTGWSILGTVVPLGTQGEFPKVYNIPVPAGALTYIVVQPVSTDGSFGPISNAASLPRPPDVISVTPNTGEQGTPVQFSATVTGSPPLTYAWDFGGGAVPNLSAEVAPTVTLGTKALYNGSLTVTNSEGSDTLNFSFDVTFTGTPPTITSVSPTQAQTGIQVQFAANMSGTAPFTYAWDFGGGANPNTSTMANPTVTTGPIGVYNGTLTVTNAFGNDLFNFQLTIANPQWHIQTVDSAGDVGTYTSIAVDSSNRPHISYLDYSNHDLKYAYFNGTWQISAVDSAGQLGMYTSIALDSNDRPHISYTDYTQGPPTDSNLKYAVFNGTTWQTSTIDSAGDTGYYTSIALDSSDRPCISYFDKSAKTLRYAHYNGAAWTLETVDSGGDVGEYSSLALDSNNLPHISYTDWSNRHLKYAHFNGSWSTETVDSGNDVGVYTSIALDSSDHPHIAYLDNFNADLVYAYNNGASWTITAVDSAGDVGYYTSIAVGSSGNPAIGYTDWMNADLKYAFWTGTAWDIATVDSTGVLGSDTSLALDSLDRPHISYSDGTNTNLKYAWFG